MATENSDDEDAASDIPEPGPNDTIVIPRPKRPNTN